MSLSRWSALGLGIVLASSLWFSVKFGSSPVMKLALFLFGLSIWYGVMTFAKELLLKNGNDRNGVPRP